MVFSATEKPTAGDQSETVTWIAGRYDCSEEIAG